ncbi:hypothetical protein [uncultured Chitinophaga sp.]|jgi:hypothetical protein|uniref:hypothetical protein n=1 Tax=uncultured Chitinophaga sp. TaxID=339340 RepID=UPI002622B945|nr:hypothetical protein [uncultured Chitinophaga sp.]
MALQTGELKFTGRLDTVIGYRRNGKYFLRNMPHKVRQTAATKRAARRFGMASRKGKLLRKAVRPQLDMRYDGTLVNRLNKLFIQSGPDQLPNLQGFHFNRHTGIEKLFLVPPVLTANGTLHIPAQELLLQGNNTHVELRLIATRISFAENRVISTEAASAIIELDEDKPFNGMALHVPLDGEGTLMVILQYRSFKACNGVLTPSGDRRYMAADVISMEVPAEELRESAFTTKAFRKRFVFRKRGIAGQYAANETSITGSNACSAVTAIRAKRYCNPATPIPSLRGPGSPV